MMIVTWYAYKGGPCIGQKEVYKDQVMRVVNELASQGFHVTFVESGSK